MDNLPAVLLQRRMHMKFIKIYTRSQLVLLRSLNRLLGRYRLPRELLKRIDYILEDGSLGRKGFVLVLLDSVRDDVREIEDAINMYPIKVELENDVIRLEIRDGGSPMTREREWYLNYVQVHKTARRIGVIYSIQKKHLYKQL